MHASSSATSAARAAHRLARVAGAWWLVLALVLAPWLGHVHGSLHGRHALGDGAAPVSALKSAPVHARSAHKAHHGLDALFGDHGQTSDCRLYDQLGHGDLLVCVPVAALPVVLPAFLLAFLEGEAIARFAALFDARGPPFLR